MRTTAPDNRQGNPPALMCMAKAPERMAFAHNSNVDTPCPSTGMTNPRSWASIVAKKVVWKPKINLVMLQLLSLSLMKGNTTYDDADELQPRLPGLDEIMFCLLPLVIVGA